MSRYDNLFNNDGYISVKNLNGTSDNKPPVGYASWKEWWEAKKGRTFGECSKRGCNNRAEVGGHVKKEMGTNEWYIVPLCKGCNGMHGQSFEVLKFDLEAVSV